MIETATKEFFITRLNRQNIKDLAFLHSAVYNLPPREDHFRKKYDTSYTGLECIGFIAYNQQGMAVAYYGVIPCLIQYGSEVMLAAQSADTMTHPQHRYKGMFVELSKMTFDLCKQEGIKLVFGFPNQNSYHGAVNKLGWQLVSQMECFTIDISSLPLEKISNRSGLFKKFYNSYTGSVLKKYDTGLKGIPSSVLKEGFVGVQRNEAYLENKTYNHSRVISIYETKIWLNERHGFMIGDLEGVKENNFTAVIRELKKICASLGKQKMQFHCSPGTGLHSLFSRNFTSTPSYPALYQDFGSVIPPEKLRFTLADIDIF